MPAAAGRANAVPFVRYGFLQIVFVSLLFCNFILSTSIILSKDEQATDEVIKTKSLVFFSMVANTLLFVTSLVVIYILVYKARTVDLVGNLRIRKRTASFKVAILSWILTSIETILRLMAFFKYRDKTLDYSVSVPWWTICGYHVLVLIQTTFQIYGLSVYEKNTRLKREGNWLITRKSFLILMVFINCYLWLLNVTKIEVLVDLTSSKMQKFFSSSVERIIYTVNRASTLAYHIESAQLFYKFYEEDDEGLIDDQYEDLGNYADHGHQQIVETESSNGVWLGFFMFGICISLAIGSFLLRTGIHDIHYAATISAVAVMVTILCITFKTTLSTDNTEEELPEQWLMFKDIVSYMAGDQVGHLRVLLFYSIGAASYHFLVTIRVSLHDGEIDLFQPVREGCKGVACLSLTVFMFWMSHKQRKLRCWRDLNVMFWTVMSLLALDLIEETFEHDYKEKDPLQIYMLPLAIDFKTYVIIHTFSDLTTAKSEYRRELRYNHARGGVASNNSSRASTPLIGNV